ncbi:DEAD/DEAH box helicase [bacterium]|nr:DEAD/DEAH box helicase [bacterium]
MNVERLLADIQGRESYGGQVIHVRERPARAATFSDAELPLHPEVASLLAAQGIEHLYSHQAEAISAVLGGGHVCTVSGTASGKTLTYLLPIVDALYRNSGSRALLIYPTKALAQDQLRKLGDYGAGERFVADTYDGDTPRDRRRLIKRNAQVVLTNPDMLHVGILPYHHTWSDFFRNLQYVVLDEVHTYRGIFGSHTANVIRRLRRLCAHYGSDPRFICCSATIANPEELTAKLTGLPLRVIADDGAPRSRKLIVFWNPPVVEQVTGRRRSGNLEAADLMALLVRREVRNITFTLARSQAELILRYAREQLREGGLDARVMAYRGGYLPLERREIERRLFAGELLGVTATTALELGVDIGGLEAVVMAGYPGTIAGAWQQMGRAGRGHEDALAVLIGLSGPMHQYVVNNPDYLAGASTERAIIDPQNTFILAGHLMCAAYELPLGDGETALFGRKMPAILEVLRDGGYVIERSRWYWVDPELYPARDISIRSASGAGYDIVHADSGALLGTMDGQSAFRMVHQGAIYLHGGQTYLVEKLDLEERVARVRPADAEYYTQPLVMSEVRRVTEGAETAQAGALHLELGPVTVRSQVVGYQRIRQVTEQQMGSEALELPAEDFETMGLWLLPSPEAMRLPEDEVYDQAGALHALEHVMIMLLPLFASCDPHDVGGISTPLHPDISGPAICVYDGYPGGVGIAEAAFRVVPELLQAAEQTIANCPCEQGCPACVQQASCGSMNRPLDKAGALKLVRWWLTERKSDE